MAGRFLGLDLRERSLTAVVVARQKGGYRIDTHARVPVAAGAGEEGLPAALKALFGRIDPRGCTCAISIPSGLAAFRYLRMPFDQPRKVRQILPFELEPSLLEPVEDLALGFQLLTSRRGRAPLSPGLVAAAVPRNRLNRFLDTLAGFRVHPETVTLSGYAAARLTASGDEDDALLLDLDRGHCTVYALSGGEVRLVRAFSTKGGRPANALRAGVFQTARAIAETLPGEFSPKTAVVVGTGVDGDLCRNLAEKLQLPVRRSDIGDGLEGNRDGWEPALMDNALGLALMEAEGQEGINFRPGPGGLKKLWSEERAAVLRSATLAAVLSVLAIVTLVLDTTAQRNRLEELNRRIAATFSSTFPEVRNVVDPLQQMRVNVREALQAAGTGEGPWHRMRVIDVLREISLRIPATIDVDLGQTVIGPEGVRISGTTSGFDAVDRIKNNLAGTPGFTSVSISSATVEKSSGRIQFRLTVSL